MKALYNLLPRFTVSSNTDPVPRWMCHKDVEDVSTIRKLSIPDRKVPIEKLCEGIHKIPLILENNKGVIIGYMILRVVKIDLEVLEFAIHPEYRRFGYGTILMKKAIKKSMALDKRLKLVVPCENLEFQLFLRSVGLKAVKIIYKNNSEYYLFRYK